METVLSSLWREYKREQSPLVDYASWIGGQLGEHWAETLAARAAVENLWRARYHPRLLAALYADPTLSAAVYTALATHDATARDTWMAAWTDLQSLHPDRFHSKGPFQPRRLRPPHVGSILHELWATEYGPPQGERNE